MCSAIQTKSLPAPPRPGRGLFGRGLPRAGVTLLTALLGLVASAPARADWPMARHDGRRTGAADGKGNIQMPVVGWKSYLGGRLAAGGLLAADVEGNGKNAFIIAAGGSISAVRPDSTVIWSTPTSGTATLLGLSDLDGDGKQEVVAYTSLRAMAIDLASGAVAWAEPAGEMGVLGDVRIGDMNGDGLPELVIEEARGADGYKNQTGYIYSFGLGFGNVMKFPPLPYPQTGGGPQSVLVDMDGKPGDELLILGVESTTHVADLLSLVDTSGTVEASSQPLGQSPYGCIPAGNLDGSPGDEVVCLIPSTTGTPGPGDTSEVFAMTLASGSLQKLWSVTLASQNQVITTEVDDLVVDLAGDGGTETVVDGYDGTSYTVHILDAKNLGHELAKIPGQQLVGTAPALKGGARVIITSTANGVALWSFAQGAVTSLGTIGDDGVGSAVDWARTPITRTGTIRPFAIDVNGDGLPDIATGNSQTGDLHAYTPSTTPPVLIGTVSPQPDVPFNGIWPMPAMDRPYPQLAMTATDGHLRLLDQKLSFTSADIKVGGFYYSGGFDSVGTSPVVASLDSPAQQILAVDSRGMLVRLDASAVTAGQSPVQVWEQPSSTSPVVAPALDGAAAGIFTLHIVDPTASPPAYTLRRLHADGSLAWEVPIQEVPRQDAVLAHFEGGGAVDIALQTGMGASQSLITYAISGADGHTLWSEPTMGCQSPDSVSVVDWNGDGVDDLAFQGGATFVLSGVDGSQLAQGGPQDCLALLIPVDPDSSGTDDIVYTASFGSVQEYAHDLSTKLFQATDQDQPFPYGAIATCPSGLVLAEGSASSPTRLQLTSLGGASPGTATSLFLVGGALYHDQMSANAAGSGQLTAVNVHKNLTGSGSPTAVVGSSDGWLYAVDPCQGTLTFAYNFNAPVGEPVFGDTDGDGFDEILVEVGDGYLYDLRGTPLVQGTGGSGTGGSGVGGSGFGGSGVGGSGAGGSGKGGSGTGGPWEYIYGRATCFCTAAPAPPAAPAALAFMAGLAAAFARRSRRRRAGAP